MTTITNITCPHKDVISEHGVSSCIACGMEITKITDWMDDLQDIKTIDNQQYCVRKLKTRSIYDDIQYLNISQHIKDIANEIYLSICENTRRGVTRKGIIFGCIFHAYKMDKNPQTHEKLIEEFKIKKKDALNGLKFIHKNAPKDSKVRHYYINVEHIIIEFMTKFGASAENKKQIIELYSQIKNTTSMLSRSRPQSVASAIIYYYMTEVLKKNMNMKDYIEIVGLSELTIQKISKEIYRVFELLKISEIIVKDDVDALKTMYSTIEVIPEFIYKKINIEDNQKSLVIEKHIQITPIQFAIENNSKKCIEFFNNF